MANGQFNDIWDSASRAGIIYDRNTGNVTLVDPETGYSEDFLELVKGKIETGGSITLAGCNTAGGSSKNRKKRVKMIRKGEIERADLQLPKPTEENISRRIAEALGNENVNVWGTRGTSYDFLLFRWANWRRYNYSVGAPRG